jgi:hypothetical protein
VLDRGAAAAALRVDLGDHQDLVFADGDRVQKLELAGQQAAQFLEPGRDGVGAPVHRRARQARRVVELGVVGPANVGEPCTPPSFQPSNERRATSMFPSRDIVAYSRSPAAWRASVVSP